MKLVHCLTCNDIFNLTRKDKSCSCGAVIGRYTDDWHAEVSGHHTAIAIGNGSYRSAYVKMDRETSDWRYDWRLERVSALFKELNELVPTMFMAWARPPSGPTNSHSKLNGR